MLYDLRKTKIWLHYLLVIGICLSGYNTIVLALYFSDFSKLEDCFYVGEYGLFDWLIIFYLVIFTFYFCRWKYAAYRNATFLNPQKMSFTPRSSIFWYFVPIAHFWMPYRAMKEIWRASSEASEPPFLSFWWASWVVSLAILYSSILIYIFADGTWVNLQLTAMLTIQTNIIDIFGYYFIYRLTSAVSQLQHDPNDHN